MRSSPIGPRAIVEKKKRYLIPCMYHFYRDPPQIVAGRGVRVRDSLGREYLDLYSGVSVHALGHCHPELVEAITRQAATLQHTTTIYLTQPIVDLAEALAGVLPGAVERTFFCASGSEANEGAALLAMLHTGRRRFLALQNSLHGRTKLTMNLTGLAMWRTDPYPSGDVEHMPVPHCSACPLGRGYDTCSLACVAAVEQALDRQAGSAELPAAMFVEPIQGNGGIVVPPADYLPALRAALHRHGVLLVADEVQTGLGRTGRWFCADRWSVVPDIVTGGKALGGGTPVGYFSTTAEIAASYTRPGASTFGGNPVTATAGLTVLKILRREGLVERAEETGAWLKGRLAELQGRQELLREVRGEGLMVGVELGPKGELTPAQATDEALERLKDAGVLLGKTGVDRNVLTFMPPLIVERADLEKAVNVLENVLASI